VVPPRPKPGRKPATDEPASKRKAQNRESQRAFRARKQQKLTEMQTQVESQEQRHRMEINSKISELHEREARISKLEALLAQYQENDLKTKREIDFWKNESDSLRKQLNERRASVTSSDAQHAGFFQPGVHDSRHDSPTRQTMSTSTPMGNSPQAYGTPSTTGEIGCGKCRTGGPCACIEEIAKFMPAVPLAQTPARTTASPMKGVHVPAQDTAALFAEREIDFTAQFSSKRNNRVDAPRVDARPSIAFLTQTNEADSRCGFCTDESNCLCRDASLQAQNDYSDALSPQARPHAATTPNDTDGCSTTGPGTCADCVRDPKQRAWCQRVAQLKHSDEDYFSSQSPRSRHSSSSGLDPIEPRTHYAPVTTPGVSIGCSDAYKLFDGRVPTDQETMDWSTLKPISPSATKIDNLPGLGLPGRKYSAIELDTAGVIATLQQTMGPLTPREKDGDYAQLVLKAQERRHTPV
jgi:hypothetical protein